MTMSVAKVALTAEVIAEFAAYHELYPAWGGLHIVLEDGNVRDGDAEFCVDWARDKGDKEGERLARLLVAMSSTQRRKLGVPLRRIGASLLCARI